MRERDSLGGGGGGGKGGGGYGGGLGGGGGGNGGRGGDGGGGLGGGEGGGDGGGAATFTALPAQINPSVLASQSLCTRFFCTIELYVPLADTA